jgi:hypothetical protein
MISKLRKITMVILGLDPGSNGGYITLNSKGRILDRFLFSGEDRIEVFKRYIESLKKIGPVTFAYVEDVHAIFGSSAGGTFSFGRNLQLAIDGLVASNIEVKFVKPKEWQKAMFKDGPKIIKKGTKNKLDTKAIALEMALKHFSVDSFYKSERSKTAHDGLVDAALIALFGLKKEKGEI